MISALIAGPPFGRPSMRAPPPSPPPRPTASSSTVLPSVGRRCEPPLPPPPRVRPLPHRRSSLRSAVDASHPCLHHHASDRFLIDGPRFARPSMRATPASTTTRPTASSSTVLASLGRRCEPPLPPPPRVRPLPHRMPPTSTRRSWSDQIRGFLTRR